VNIGSGVSLIKVNIIHSCYFCVFQFVTLTLKFFNYKT
jgi:hypothetical protein